MNTAPDGKEESALRAGTRRYWEEVRSGLRKPPRVIAKENREKAQLEFYELVRKQKEAEDRLANQHEVLNLKSEALTGRVLASKQSILAASQPFTPVTGVYFLVQGNVIAYIGQSVSIQARIRTHQTDAKVLFDAVAYVPCVQEDLDILESLYIHMFQPPCNGGATGGGKAAPFSMTQIAELALSSKGKLTK